MLLQRKAMETKAKCPAEGSLFIGGIAKSGGALISQNAPLPSLAVAMWSLDIMLFVLFLEII